MTHLSVFLPCLCPVGFLGSLPVCHHYENHAIIRYDFDELVNLVGFSHVITH